MAVLKIKQSTIKTIIFDFDGTLAKLNIDFHRMRTAVGKLILSYGITRDELHTDFVLEMIDSCRSNLKSALLTYIQKVFLMRLIP